MNMLKSHPLVVPITTFLVLFFVTLSGVVFMGGQTLGASDSRVVHLHVDGVEQVVPTRATTVGELLDRLDIKVVEKDIIEPALDTEITDNNFEVNLYKARSVLVVDGDKNTVVETAEPTPQAVAKDAGLKVYPEDRISSAPGDVPKPTDIVQKGLIAEKIVIDRATAVTMNLYGKQVTVRSHAQTVGELLAEKSVSIRKGDTLKPNANTRLSSNTQIFIVRLGTKIDTREEVIPMPVEATDDPTLPEGVIIVKQQGSDGEKLVTYEIGLKNGKEASRKVIQEVIVTKPVEHVITRGTKVIYSNPSANVKLGKQIAEDMGWSSQFSCIYSIFQRESGWNHLANNRNSGAYGIPQALPGSKMGDGWQTDPSVQIRWGINYMVNRYGSPCGAQNFWSVNHWY